MLAGGTEEGARHVTETRHLARRNRHRYRQELVPRRGARSPWCDRAPAEMVAWPGRGATCQLATVLDRYGGLRRRASSQSQAPNAWPRRPPDAGEIRAPLPSALKPSQRHRLDGVIDALGEDQRRAWPRW